MNIIQPTFAVMDGIVLGLIALVPLLMVLGIYTIRKDIRAAAQLKTTPIKLKTTEAQRRRWRQAARSQDLINLLDDFDTLLERLKGS